ncbi:hypothetical protein SNE40_020081 [Patella caerulea]|uniref:Pyridoxal-dependent decarboxylase domain-containing protein 1 n=2 Tax=Patella caerulea TaxID=87958 RepID=A0AAN8G229_PATCE
MTQASSASEIKTMNSSITESLEQENKAPSPTANATVPAHSLEQNFNQYFMNPMLAEMEKNVRTNTEILDRINQQMENERKDRLRKTMSAHIPEALKGSGQKMEIIMQTLEELITYDDIGDEGTNEKKERCAKIQHLDKHGQASVLAHSIVAYISTLDEEHLKKFTSKITSDCELWLSRLFRFTDSSVIYHEEDKEGLVKVCRLAMYQKFPKYVTEGYDALYSRPPVIYISAAAKSGLGHHLCLQLGLPFSCICTVPCNTMFGGVSKMDVSMLEKLIQDDISAAKKPTLVIGYAGTPQVGQVDNLQRLQEICKTNSIWLHVEGNNLATLMMFSVPSSVQSAKSGDSMTVDLSRWLGIPALPFATLYKTPDPTLAIAAGLNAFNPRLKLSCLSIWICLQSLGHDGIISKIKASTHLAKKLFEHIDKLSAIKQISREQKDKQKDVTSLGDIFSRAINALLVFEIVTPTVVFRYAEDASGPGSIVASYSSSGNKEYQQTDDNSTYYNALNTWLVDTLQCSVPQVPVTAVDINKEGVCIRYSPLETAQYSGTTEEDIQTFAECLTENLAVLDATVAQRHRFRSIVENTNNLVPVNLPSWAGLGAIRYIPDHWLNQTPTEQGKIDISNINGELVHKLKSMDTAFSTGHCSDNEICVRFGLITANTDVEELVALVHTTGKQIEESSKYLESMSEIIKKNIDVANQELQKESVDKLMQEGVMRQVPLVGSLINWFSPPKDPTKGRTFNLNSGTIESTETIYRYHMQIQPGSSESNTSTTEHSKSAGEVKAGIINQTTTSNKLQEQTVSSAEDNTGIEDKTVEAKEPVISETQAEVPVQQ